MNRFRQLLVLSGWLWQGWFLIEADGGLRLDAMAYLTKISEIIFLKARNFREKHFDMGLAMLHYTMRSPLLLKIPDY